MISKTEKKNIISKFAKSKNDCGSAEVQIAILSGRIKGLGDHFKENKKDHHSRLGLMKMVGLRRGLLKYLKRKDPSSYQNIIKELKIRG